MNRIQTFKLLVPRCRRGNMHAVTNKPNLLTTVSDERGNRHNQTENTKVLKQILQALGQLNIIIVNLKWKKLRLISMSYEN